MSLIVLAHAGGPAVRSHLSWLTTSRRASVVTVTLDIGQGLDADTAREYARAAGALRAHLLDRRDVLRRQFLLPALQADVTGASLATDLVWPLLAQALVEVAELEGASAVAHGCAIDSLDEARLAAAVKTLRPDLDVIPIARAHGSAARIDGGASNGWPGRAHAALPVEPAYVEVGFEQGVATVVNGVDMPIDELWSSLDTIAGAYGLTALAILRAAHLAVRRLVVDDGFDDLCDAVGRYYGDLVTRGLWFTPGRRALDAFIAEVQPRLTGSVRLAVLPDGGLEQVSASSPTADAAAAARRPVRSADAHPVAC